MKSIIFEVFESPDGGYEANALGHRIHTQGDSWDELKSMVIDSVRCHFEEEDRPEIIRLIMTREEVLVA